MTAILPHETRICPDGFTRQPVPVRSSKSCSGRVVQPLGGGPPVIREN